MKSTKALKKELERQLCACVQWQRSVEFMSRSGVTTYVEIGPGNVLSGLIKRISKDAEVMHVGNVSSVKGLPR
jgi:[acyl-carrier-protein] S-malonyltransferase